MPVIRNQQARHLAPRAIALEMADVHSEAAELLTAARAEVNELLARARAEAEDLRNDILEKARQEGERAGHEAGLERGRAEAMEQFRSMVQDSRELYMSQIRMFHYILDFV